MGSIIARIELWYHNRPPPPPHHSTPHNTTLRQQVGVDHTSLRFNNLGEGEITEGLYQGDMILTDSQLTALKERKVIKDERFWWPEVDGVVTVPYRFGDGE